MPTSPGVGDAGELPNSMDPHWAATTIRASTGSRRADVAEQDDVLGSVRDSPIDLPPLAHTFHRYRNPAVSLQCLRQTDKWPMFARRGRASDVWGYSASASSGTTGLT